ncbi:hypothetical protein JL720_7250 [Aureococcus anophagefferens]|nr:hypothetical protein JL720_7250 [Aureococcus anophagefferens]
MRLAGFNDVDDRGVRGPGRSAGLLPVLGAAATEGLLYDLAALPRAARRGELASLCAFSLNASALAAVAAGAPWGWKEPRALFHLPAFGLAFPAFRFLHVARDVRSLASAHVEGDVAVMRAWWRETYAAVVDARRAAISRAAPGGSAPPMACDRLYHDALLWRAVFAEFWAEEQLALVKAGAALGPDRYAVARVEDLVADPGAARVLLDWVHGGAYGGDAAAAAAKIYAGRGGAYGGAARACDLLVAAAFQNPKDVRAGPLAFPKKCALLDFLDDAGGLPGGAGASASRAAASTAAASGAAPRRARVGARLRVLAAVKGRCWARADAADAAVVASATDVYAALRPCADLDCGGGDSPTWAAGGRTCAWVAENPTRACCKVAGDDGAAARDACREACCRPAKPGKG